MSSGRVPDFEVTLVPLLSDAKISSRLKHSLTVGILAVEKVMPAAWSVQSPELSAEKVTVRLELYSRYFLFLYHAVYE